jgi:hypothetical protein
MLPTLFLGQEQHSVSELQNKLVALQLRRTPPHGLDWVCRSKAGTIILDTIDLTVKPPLKGILGVLGLLESSPESFPLS